MVKPSAIHQNNNFLNISSFFFNSSIQANFSLKQFPTNGELGRESFAKATAFNPLYLIIPIQTHSTKVVFCDIPGKVENCDGVFTNNPENVCSIQVADCMPIFFAHRFKPVYGLIHAGWRGLKNGILTRSGELLKRRNYNLFDFDVVIGPSIQDCCFEVNNDVARYFNLEFITMKEPHKFHINIQKTAQNELIQLGFVNEKIMMMNDCTFCNDEHYHSYRRNGSEAGRMIGLIGINGELA